jgi:hypothetical protein
MMIDSASGLLVRRTVVMPGGTARAISVIFSSLIGPGPLGIAETSPMAEAPYRIAIAASSDDAIQQIFTRGRAAGFMSLPL